MDHPVLIEEPSGRQRVLVFDHSGTGGQCTARARSGRRCNNVVWDQGQIASRQRTIIEGRAVTLYGPLHGEPARRYLDQRCRVHDTPDAENFCDPEWQVFDPATHTFLTYEPRLTDLAEDLLHARRPAVADLAAALRGSLSASETQRLVEFLQD